MTIEEAIKHAEEVANANERLCETVHPSMQLSDYGKCAKEHRQLTEWLKDHKRLLEQTRWIPASERLPKAGEYVGNVAKYYLVQNEYGDMLVARYCGGKRWEQIYQYKYLEDEVIAWMPLPEPYKASPTEVESVMQDD